jgi:mono/diheme cytochrome c family protein
VNETWFQPKTPGRYRGQCAEFCGLQHAAMDAQVEAMPAEEFESWLEEEARAQEAGTSELGAETYAGACSKCHGEEGQGDIGPLLRGNRILSDPQAVEQVVRNGIGEMPPVGRDWRERQMDALTKYLEEDLLGGQ